MAKAYAKSFYNSTKWKKCRAAYIASVYGGYIVDHIIEITPENIDDANITLNHDNLQFLCLDCHNKKTFSKPAVIDGCWFDESE